MPGKSMAMLAGRPSLAHIIARLRRSCHLDGIVVATPKGPANDPIRACADAEGVACFSGSEEDVLGRTLGAARSVGADVIVLVTGDNPLIDPLVVGRVIEAYRRERPDYASNCLVRTYPDGIEVEVFATAVLAEVDGATREPAHREHVTLYICERPHRYRLLNVPAPPEHTWPDLRITLDTEDDYRLIGAIYDALYPVDPAFGLPETLAWVRAHPNLLPGATRTSAAGRAAC